MISIFTKLKTALERGEAAVLVSIIASSGSTPRGSGARMLVLQDGSIAGTIGGGAVEYRSQQLSAEALENRRSSIHSFKLTSDEVAGLGMICGGDVMVYLQYISPGHADTSLLCDRAIAALRGPLDAWLITDITDEQAWSMSIYTAGEGLSGDAHIADATPLLRRKAVRIQLDGHVYYSEPISHSGLVYVFGAGHVGRELVPALARTGFRCIVVDDRPEFADTAYFPDAQEVLLGDFGNIASMLGVGRDDYIVIMTRGHQHDYSLQIQALGTSAHYIGVMGSRGKAAQQSKSLMEEEGFSQADVDRLHMPIGLQIGAETPSEIAVSIAAELITVRSGRTGEAAK